MGIAQHRWAGAAMVNQPKSKLSLQPYQIGTFIGDTPLGNEVVGAPVPTWRNLKKGVEYISTPKIPMQDWDFPDPLHPDAAVTIRNLGDAYENLKDFTKANPDEAWKLYLTPGGVRAWNLSGQGNPQQLAFGYQQTLNSDPLYNEYAQRSNTWASRLSGKPKRADDFVAFPLATIGEGLPNPTNVDWVTRFHDIPIIENRYVSNVDMSNTSILQKLVDQTRGLPGRIVDPIYESLNLAKLI